MPSKKRPQSPPVAVEPLFPSFFIGGFECSTHRRRDGVRLDMVRASRHEELLREDYKRLKSVGIRTCREGLRWHLIETRPGRFDFSSVRPFVKVAREEGIEVIWDIFHFGWPDFVDPFAPEFVAHFGWLAEAFARFLRDDGEESPWIVPVNEPSFVSWGGGDVGYLNPFAHGRGLELKVQLVRAHIAAVRQMREVLPSLRVSVVDPLIHIAADPSRPYDQGPARGCADAQYEASEMMSGRRWPGLGGFDTAYDAVGVNYYPRNQWVHIPNRILWRGDPLYRPLRDLLRESWERHRRPLYLSETGTEGHERAEWLRYVCDEAWAAIQSGVPVGGICLYPILNHPGWDDERHCPNGLWDYADERGHREADPALLAELLRQQKRFGTWSPPAGKDADRAVAIPVPS